MRVGGEDDVDLGLRPRGEGCDQTGELVERASRLLADVQPQIERDLIVSRTGGVQHARRFSERCGETRLDRHVHVFLDRELRRVEVPQLHQLGANRERRLPRNDSAARQHGEVREASREILPQELPIERQRAGEREHLGEEPTLAGGLGLGEDHCRSPPCSRLNSCKESPSRLMNPSAALWSNLSAVP